jgi:transcriptional regulator with XRE-family HTH domain
VNEATIAARIRYLRKSHGYTLDDLAYLIDSTRYILSSVEKQKNSPTIRLILQIADVMKTTPEWILGIDNALIPPEQNYDENN